MSNNEEFYKSNKDFQEYVDKYCEKLDKPVEEALKDNIVQMIADFYRDKMKEEEGKTK